jgi:nucleoside-diphosphate-sugar epimerase
MKILIIGGTSFFGKEIVELALDAGHEVTIFSRGNARPDFWSKINHITGDRNDVVDFANKLSDKHFDAVIDNIAFNRDHVVNTLTALEDNIGRYILTSTTAVYIGAGPFDQPLRENDVRYDLPENPQLATFPEPTSAGMVSYATGKIAAERALVSQQRVPYTIIRPHIVVGPEDNHGRLQFFCQRLTDGKPLMLINGGVQSVQFVFSRDLARTYLLALDSTNAVNQVYTITGNKTCRLIEWVELLANYLGVQPTVIPIPLDVLQKTDFSYAEGWVLRGTLTFDVSKAIADLIFQPTPIEKWTKIVAQWYQETTHANDSPGYSEREKEIKFAEKYLAKIAQLTS